MARNKHPFMPRRPQSAPKASRELNGSKETAENTAKGQPKKTRRIGRTAANWTGNELSSKSREESGKNNKNNFTSNFDFRNEDEGPLLFRRRRRSRSAPYVSVDNDDDDVFTKSTSDETSVKAVKKLDVDLSALQTVASANDFDTLSVQSVSDMGSLDKSASVSLLNMNEEKAAKVDPSYNLNSKASYISTSHSGQTGKNTLQKPRPKSILSNRIKSAPSRTNKKVCIVERPKSYNDRFNDLALRKFNENFRPRPICARDYLPRRSFFSCHDNLLFQAGINPRDLTNLEIGRRKPRICDDKDDDESSTDEDNDSNNKQESNADDPKKNKVQNATKIEDQEHQKVKARSISATSLDNLSETSCSEGDQGSSVSQVSSFRVAARVTGVIAKMKKQGKKYVVSRRKSLHEEEYDSRYIRVDPRPIVDYLKLVKEKPDEYLAMKCLTQKTGVGAIDNLVSAGQAFNKNGSLSLVSQAAYELGSKTQPKVIQRYEAEKAKLGTKKHSTATRPQSSTSSSRPQSSASIRSQHRISSSRPPATHNPRYKLQQGVTALSVLNALSGSNTEDDGETDGNTNSNGWAELRAQMTDVERKRAEVEVWLKKLSTGQFVKAREMALKELGEEASSIKRWWLSHRYCRYLRQRMHTTEDFV